MGLFFFVGDADEGKGELVDLVGTLIIEPPTTGVVEYVEFWILRESRELRKVGLVYSVMWMVPDFLLLFFLTVGDGHAELSMSEMLGTVDEDPLLPSEAWITGIIR